jgi:hypothetical protein
MWKPTKNPKIEALTKSYTKRALQLSYEMKVVPEADGRRLCLWCGTEELHGSKLKKYCSKECSEAIFTWAQPQKENGLHALLVRQDWKCNTCQFDYVPTRDKVNRYFKQKNYLIPNFGPHSSKRYMKIFKNNCEEGKKPEVDHVIPIYKGGQSLGLDNLQAICYLCHKAKTVKDLSGKRKKKDVV